MGIWSAIKPKQKSYGKPIDKGAAQFAADEIQRLEDRIKRLEEALSEIELAMKQPASNHRLMQIAGPARQVINIIKKAKEAKP